jgi:hypothetical protein
MPKHTNKIWTEEEDSYLRENYAKESIENLMGEMKRTKDSILSRASMLGIKKEFRKSRKIHSLNEEYFKEINSQKKAFWYGFLWADGSLYYTNFELTLQSQDEYVIEEFRRDVNSGALIKTRNKKYQTRGICIGNKRFSYHLNNLNITNRKSYSDLTPIVEDKYFPNFLLGLYDGDGTLTPDGAIVITCSSAVSEWLKKEIARLYDIEGKIYNIKGTIAKRFVVNRWAEVARLLNSLYEQNEFYLKRKREKFIEQINKREKRCRRSDDQLLDLASCP